MPVASLKQNKQPTNQSLEVQSANRHHSARLCHRILPQGPSQPQVASATPKEIPKLPGEVVSGCPHFCVFFKAKS